jgi:hypothetical protein
MSQQHTPIIASEGQPYVIAFRCAGRIRRMQCDACHEANEGAEEEPDERGSEAQENNATAGPVGPEPGIEVFRRGEYGEGA